MENNGERSETSDLNQLNQIYIYYIRRGRISKQSVMYVGIAKRSKAVGC